MATTFKHIEMVGRLAKDEEIRKYEYDDRKTSVFINKPGDIQYKVSKLSIKNDISEDLFTGYTSSIRNLEFVDDEYASAEDRVKSFIDFYTDYLFVFTHKVDTMGNYKIDVADVVPSLQRISANEKFIAIPCFSSKEKCDTVNSIQLFKTYENYEQFKKLLIAGKAIGRVYNFQINDTSFPEFIVWNDNKKMCAFGPIKSASRSAMDSLILQINPEDFYEIDLDDESDDTIEYIVQSDQNPTILHFAESRYLKIVDMLSDKSAQKVDISTSSSTPDTLGEIKYDELIDNQVLDDLRELPTEKTEKEILEFFRYHSQKKKLFYSPKDIVNFHTAVKTGSLVILSGMSGTGKSALVDTYARALGIEKNVLTIPVRPAWNDDSDLLGYVDLVHMVYRPSDTGFINKIVEASRQENADKIYLICLDEMNLARVEHYFSQFLSILEKPVGSRELVLYDEQYAGQLYNSAKYPQRVAINDNIKFIGTVNIDESTYHFSDKVLDRANVITLEVLDYSHPNTWKEDKYRAANTPEWTNGEFRTLIKKDDISLENQLRIREFLWNMHMILHNMNSNLGVGPRIVKSIETYLRNLPDSISDFSLSMEEGLDYQVAQRILTKVRGPEEQIKGLFQQESQEIKVLESHFNDYSDISNFDRCRKIIMQKEKELKIYGYCL